MLLCQNYGWLKRHPFLAIGLLFFKIIAFRFFYMHVMITKFIFKYRSWLLLGIFFLGILLFFLNGGGRYIDYHDALSRYEELRLIILQNSISSYIFYFLSYLLVVTFSLPLASLFTILGSALFGWKALLIILFAASIGASLVFLAARTILSDWLYNRTASHRFLIRADFKQNAFLLLLGLRLFPIAPFWIVNIVPAFTTITLKNYFLATFIDIMPGTILYVWLGQTIDTLLSKGEWPNMMTIVDSRIWIPLFGLGLLILATGIYRSIRARTHIEDV